MNEKLKQFPLLLSPNLYERIEEYRWANRLPSVAAAMRELLEKALETKGKKKAKPS